MDDRYVSFRGQDGNEAEEFIQAVRRAAFDADKDSDDGWMARFASTCMSGKALRWHASLDDDVQESWKRLMKAILARYPPADEDAIVPSASAAPVAPTAALPPVAPWPSSFPQVNVAPPAAVPPQSGALKSSSKPSDGASGIIEIQYARTNQSIGYLSETLKFNGAAQVASYRSSAQKVTVNNEPSSTYSNIALDTEPRSRDRFIGITWLQTGGARASAGYRYAAIVFTQGSDGSKSSIDSFWYEGDSEAAIWDIASDGKVTATSGGKPLAFYVYDKTDQINLFPDFNAYISSRGIAHRWDRVVSVAESCSSARNRQITRLVLRRTLFSRKSSISKGRIVVIGMFDIFGEIPTYTYTSTRQGMRSALQYN